MLQLNWSNTRRTHPLTLTIGTAYLNCEVRQFTFTEGSSAEEAHLVETAESKKKRGKDTSEADRDVLSEIESVEGHA